MCESPDVAPREGGKAAYSAIALCVATNFTMLRRRFGQAGWQAVMDTLVASLDAIVPNSSIERIAPDCIQISVSASSQSALEQALETALAHCETLFQVENECVTLGLVAGAAITLTACDTLTLLEAAEHALGEACRGRRLVVVESGLAPHGFEEIAMLRDLPMAAANDELFLLYQPKINVREQTVTSAEALIRWLHPAYGLIMPDAFIGPADDSGDILGIAIWTLRKVIDDHHTLCERGHRLRLFINVSGRLLTDAGFIDAACEIVQASGADIGFEITETSVIHDPDIAISNLERCAAVGIDLAIDDYGSGLSSLAYLKRLPARELKIDKQFVTQLTNSHRDPLIVRSTIDLAHALGMHVTAEGVETPAALALLTVMGCEMVQGYLISPPLKLEAFTTYLNGYEFESWQGDTTPTVIRPASFWKRA
jgi:diguanylate cyclase